MLVSPQRVLASLPHFVRGRSSFSIVMRRKLSDQPRWDREQLARYGIGVEDAQRVVENAIGGANVSTVVNGQERYRVSGGPHPHLAQSWRPGRSEERRVGKECRS